MQDVVAFSHSLSIFQQCLHYVTILLRSIQIRILQHKIISTTWLLCTENINVMSSMEKLVPYQSIPRTFLDSKKLIKMNIHLYGVFCESYLKLCAAHAWGLGEFYFIFPSSTVRFKTSRWFSDSSLCNTMKPWFSSCWFYSFGKCQKQEWRFLGKGTNATSHTIERFFHFSLPQRANLKVLEKNQSAEKVTDLQHLSLKFHVIPGRRMRLNKCVLTSGKHFVYNVHSHAWQITGHSNTLIVFYIWLR